MIPEGVHIRDLEDKPPPVSRCFTLFQIEDRRLRVSCAQGRETCALPTMKKLEYIVELKRVIRRKFTLGTGDGWLKADGETIYTAKDLRVGLFQADEAAPASV